MGQDEVGSCCGAARCLVDDGGGEKRNDGEALSHDGDGEWRVDLALEDGAPWDLVILVTRGFVEVDSGVVVAITRS